MSKPAASTVRIRVRATAVGFYSSNLVPVGMSFSPLESEFTSRWMVRVDDSEPDELAAAIDAGGGGRQHTRGARSRPRSSRDAMDLIPAGPAIGRGAHQAAATTATPATPKPPAGKSTGDTDVLG